MDYKLVEEKMNKAIDHLFDELANVRAGRANPAILNKISVDYYGAATPINQIGTVSVPEARQILITPWDKSLLSAVEKAIQKSDIGINPINDGNSIRINFPELNEQRRKELVKDVKALCEEAKVAVRNGRRDAVDQAKAAQKANEMTEDELRSAEEQIQKLTDKYVEKIDGMFASKEKEIMEI